MPEVTLLGFIGNDQNLDVHLRNNDNKEIAQWFSSYVDEKTLLSDWLGLKLEKQNNIAAN
ncbi:hypothetical protein [Methylobacter sp. S3L5C]|uniref:hypothetical protein n=1 Tax=Methylobacter sp. S3L5C TaxID=2839024 RepID=UPI001FACE2A1|nr:hypothetical protein [Methylobacter sp. S3L5C]UOA06893.1 hypothetical protein KKZ03_11065 [Methylobacter sp. S3L5C]